MKLRTKIAAMLIGLFSIGLSAGSANAQVKVIVRHHRPVHRHTVVRTYYGYGHDRGHHYGHYRHHHVVARHHVVTRHRVEDHTEYHH